MDEEEEQEEEGEEVHHNHAFQMVGTVSNLSDEPPPHILEEYCVSDLIQNCPVRWFHEVEPHWLILIILGLSEAS